MWRELAAELGLETFAPAAPDDIAAAEAAVGCALPQPLRELLAETDGIDDRVVFSARDIAQVNRDMRTNADFPELCMPFDALLYLRGQRWHEG
jgi:cell wall assembly regulator SMI1